MRPFFSIVVSTQQCERKFIETFYQLHNLIKDWTSLFLYAHDISGSYLCSALRFVLQKRYRRKARL
jgi:hypothetical protein